MQVNIKPNEQETIVQIIGQLNTIATTDQADELQRILDIADKVLVIDCSELEYISSAGLRFFMRLNHASKEKGGKVRITNVNEDVAEIFSLRNFQNIFEISKR
jgi:anti-sigma B factor antagonist